MTTGSAVMPSMATRSPTAFAARPWPVEDDIASPVKQLVIDFAFATYNDNVDLQAATVEWGHVLYERDGAVHPGPRVMSAERNRVQLYSPDDLVRVAGADRAFDAHYVGDYHAHTFGANWTSLLPSPEDLTDVSVLYDLWRLENAAPLNVSPRLQVVQTLFCGDVFVLEAVADRRRYANLEEQSVSVGRIGLAYRAAFHQAENDHGDADLDATPEDFDAFVNAVLDGLNATIAGRAVITFHPNAAGRVDREPGEADQ